eukprot:CAMPEP_0116542556 /NCGR_PEP_ID=MMETSP0397-20121206/1079_1 /TAXON_ID=216820 /ORGANISM="Cyclophora tenuis, Strain ECT3854" /LENGTH=260 /DNA_ID=CAMNT_0004066573 /DNA_START=25 /DNA_END=807 /DNA_ORIENTATION=+
MSSVTPAFPWALPSIDPSTKKKSTSQPIVNPLLKRVPPKAVNNAASAMEMKSSGGIGQNRSGSDLRQRKNNTDASKKNGPPGQSLATGGLSRVPTASIADAEYKGGALVLYGQSDRQIESEEIGSWVVVYGFSTEAEQDEVLRRFRSFGNVVAVRGGKSNWVALQYRSPIEAEKALCHHTSVLGGCVIGVVRMDPRLRDSLEWSIAPMVQTAVGETAPQRKKSLPKSGFQDDDIFLQERAPVVEKKSVCERFLGALFGWD